MGARSVANLTISLGFIEIGVKAFIAAKAEQVSFKITNPDTGNKVSQKLVDSVGNRPKKVSRKDTVKGFEDSQGNITVFSKEDIDALQGDSLNKLVVNEFVSVSSIDPLHIEETFFLSPDRGMDEGYQILYLALKSSKKAAIGTWHGKNKNYFVSIRAYKDHIVMHQMFYNNEVRSFSRTRAIPEVDPKNVEKLKLLIDGLSSKLDRGKYRDSFIDNVLAMVSIKKGSKNPVNKCEKHYPSANITEAIEKTLSEFSEKSA